MKPSSSAVPAEERGASGRDPARGVLRFAAGIAVLGILLLFLMIIAFALPVFTEQSAGDPFPGYGRLDRAVRHSGDDCREPGSGAVGTVHRLAVWACAMLLAVLPRERDSPDSRVRLEHRRISGTDHDCHSYGCVWICRRFPADSPCARDSRGHRLLLVERRFYAGRPDSSHHCAAAFGRAGSPPGAASARRSGTRLHPYGFDVVFCPAGGEKDAALLACAWIWPCRG